ncbi:MAG: tungstate transport system substrate-binding protein [Thermoanaerobaculia bacterium]|jgi:tungstate transport system substrate-binding protein|nr:tungstate transport system substrate-binding protein [Thermoanaerobaculia bacterium]
MRRALAAFALLLAACSHEPKAKSFVLATTTTVQGSGVLPMLIVEFKRDTGVDIHPLVVSSQRALDFAAQHEADVTITHDPGAERRFVKTHGAALYRQFMWNDFVIVGPPDDPADVAHARSAADAFARIHGAYRIFLSRNDQSGTNTKELALWRAALVYPEFNPGYIKMGQPMAALLRTSSEMRAYTLSDRATFEQLADTLQLRILFAGDPFLRNTYAVILPRSSGRPEAQNAERFVDWLLRGRGHALLESYEIKGKRAFHVM